MTPPFMTPTYTFACWCIFKG